MRRAVCFGLLTVGALVLAASASPAQTATTAPVPATASSAASTSTSRPVKPVGATGPQGNSRLPTLGEGFPWITVGAVILVAGLVGARLRRAARR